MEEFLVICNDGKKIVHTANCIEDVYIYYSESINNEELVFQDEIAAILPYNAKIQNIYKNDKIERGISL